MSWVSPIGSNPLQIDYRLGLRHGCVGGQINNRAFGYRTDMRERPLRWIGRGLTEVGLTAGSELTPEQFHLARNLMNGLHPHTGDVLVQHKQGVPREAKVPLAPLVRAIDGIAAEADTTIADIFGLDPAGRAAFKAFERAQRSVTRQGETAMLRADHAGRLADAAGLQPHEVWTGTTYEDAVRNLTRTHTTTEPDGTIHERLVPNRITVGNLGYDITFTLPKSYSLLLAFADEDTAAELESRYIHGTDTMLGWLEHHTAYGMRGHHGDGHSATTEPGTGFLGWAMIHRAARPVSASSAESGSEVVPDIGDPHWHVHYTIANMTRGQHDRQWSTVAAGGRDLMRHIPAADKILQAVARHDLTQRFGIRWRRNTRTNLWEIADVPDTAIRHFSKHGNKIVDTLLALGFTREDASRRVQQIAEHHVREPKPHTTAAPDATLRETWRAEAIAHGIDPDQLASDALSHHRPDSELPPQQADQAAPDEFADPAAGEGVGQAAADEPRNPTLPELIARLQDPETGLTAHTRRFSRLDLLAAIADAYVHLPSLEYLEELAELVLAQQGFHRATLQGGAHSDGDRQSGWLGTAGSSRQLGANHMANADLYTTSDILAAEQLIAQTAVHGKDRPMPIQVDASTRDLAATTVEAAQGFPLSDEQRREFNRITSSGRAYDALIGGPGSGKTTLMRAVRVAFESAGFVVAGAATQGVAAQNLQAESGTHSRTVAQWLWRIDNGPGLAGIDLLILDEATLTHDRDRAALLRAASQSGTRVLEIGDPAQLRGVGCGSMFGTVHKLVGGGELLDNRRQADEYERAAIFAWRNGDYTEALTSWADRGRLVATETPAEATAAMLTTWLEQRRGAPNTLTEIRGLLMVAATNQQVDHLNTAAQAARYAAGELGPDRLYRSTDGTELRLHEGDIVHIRRTDRDEHHHQGDDVFNGYRGVITTIHPDGAIDVEWNRVTTSGERIRETATIPADYVTGHTPETELPATATRPTGFNVSLGYALTIHKSQGLTIGADHATWTGPDGTTHGGAVLFHAAGADNPGHFVASTRHTHHLWTFIARTDVETPQDTYVLGEPRSAFERTRRVITKIAEHAERTATNANDRPVLADLKRLPGGASDSTRKTPSSTPNSSADIAGTSEPNATPRPQPVEVTDQMRVDAANLLRTIWPDAPDLLAIVTDSPAFTAVARNLADIATRCDPEHLPDLVRQLTNALPADALRSPRIHDKAAYTAAMIRIAHQRNEARLKEPAQDDFAQLRDQAADLIRETWHKHPELADAVISSPAFGALARALDRHTANRGMDSPRLGEASARTLLAALPIDKISDPTIRDKAAFTTYLLTRIADRLEHEHHARERAAHQHRVRQQRHELATRIVREAWNHHPIAADHAINGPAFPILARRITDALDAGHTLTHITTTIASINATTITSTRIANPAAYLAAAFARKVTEPATTASPRKTDASPGQVGPSRRQLELSTATPTPHWRTRELGALTAEQLAEAATSARRQLDDLVRRRAELVQRLDTLRADTAQDRGPNASRVHDNLRALLAKRAQVEHYEHLHEQARACLDTAAEHAAIRADSEYQLSTLAGLRSQRRRAELDQRIHEHLDAEHQAHQQARELTEQAEPLRLQLGDADQRHRIVDAAERAENNYPQDRLAAIDADQRLLTATWQQLAVVDAQIASINDHQTVIATEHQLRADAPALTQAFEDYQRSNELNAVPSTAPHPDNPSRQPEVAPRQLTPAQEPSVVAPSPMDHPIEPHIE
ncbi:MobF family relaxase [Labedaea rhizosphaerae]|uniref:Conjugative relaxase-like TrwC/TraI family protein n=1 Tax=Labedaea rhizosphaerae TaxID=598644 RepID=A0A4R6SIA8_LABRH|nr:MobF family relaxase [Labedaea rhizosphaerae]TDQ00609.1 conjugative relaxase-like TrwC/TraI family protein [Labedaea rhizosphaerae]